MNKRRKSKNRRKSESLPPQFSPHSIESSAWLPLPQRLGLALMCALLAFLVFLPTLNFGFVDWDDTGLLLDTTEWRGLGGEQIRWMFTTTHYGHYQPITWLTYGLDYEIWGMNPRGYHLTNTLFHSANAMLVWFLASFLLRRALPEAARERPLLVGIAATFVALAFAVHPMRVESVAWATERRDLVSAFFILLTVLTYLHSTVKQGRSRAIWFGASLAIYVISMLSKVGGAPLPLVLLVLDWYPLRRLDMNPLRWSRRGQLGVLLEKAPFLLVAIVFSIATIQQQMGRWLIPIEEHDLYARTAQAFYGLVFYPWKTLLPTGLSPLYPLNTLEFNPFEARFLISAVIVFIIAFALVKGWRRTPAALAAVLVYALMIGPLLGYFQNGPQIVADRYSYLSTLSLVFLLAGAAVWWLHRRPSEATQRTLAAAAFIVIAATGLLAMRQSQVWRDSPTLWAAMLDSDDRSSFAQNGHGYMLLQAGDARAAERHFRAALEIDPRNVQAHQNLADSLKAQGVSEVDAYRAAIAYHAGVRSNHYHMGNALLREQRNEEAVEAYQTALNISYDYPRCHANLAMALARLDRLDEARQHYEVAVSLDPTLWNARDGLALVLIRLGLIDEAFGTLESLLSENPAYQPARDRLDRLRREQAQLR